MKGRLTILILAVIFGLAAAYGTYQYIQRLEGTYRSSGQFVTVAVAKVQIPIRQVITDQMVNFTEIPANYAHPAALGKPGEVVGKVARSQIYPGDQITKNRVAGPGDPGEGLAMLVEPGRRAITVAVNDVSGLAGMLRPGDHVDVLGTVNTGKETVTSTIVQDIKVLAVNKSLGNQVEAKQPQNSTVTLSANPFEAQHITLASEKGAIRLLLRTPADEAKPNIPSTSVNHLVR